MREPETGQRNSGGVAELKEAEEQGEVVVVVVVEGEERWKENFHLALPLPMVALLSRRWR